MKNPHKLTRAQITRNRRLINALRRNKRKATKIMYDDKGGRCCLAVALDTAVKMGFQYNEQVYPKKELMLPPGSMKHWYGWADSDPILHDDKGNEFSAAQFNDGGTNDFNKRVRPKTHTKIADLIQKEFLPCK